MCCCRVPISVEMMDEYEGFCKAFKRSVHEHQDQGNLDLGELTAVPSCNNLYCGQNRSPHSAGVFAAATMGTETCATMLTNDVVSVLSCTLLDLPRRGSLPVSISYTHTYKASKLV